MSAKRLAVYLHDEQVAVLDSAGLGLAALQYTEQAVERHGVGALLLSLNLPVREEPYPGVQTRAFLDGLLPEADVRIALAEQLRTDPADTFGLLAEVGRECAGAIVIVPEDEAPPRAGGDLDILDGDGLARYLAALPRVPLGVERGGRVRLSLAGAQGKLAVVRMESDRFALPRDATPTTHILKPSPDRFPGLAENEAACMEVARRAGFSVATTELIEVAGRPVLLVQRFDRRQDQGGVRRVHQEDIAQALGARQKYEEDGGPSLASMAGLLRDHAAIPLLDQQTLLQVVVLNVLLGNADAHAKNLSLRLDGGVALQPLYDLVSTTAWPELSTGLALFVGGRSSLEDVTTEAVADEARSWGLGEHAARRLISETVEAVREATHDDLGMGPRARAIVQAVRARSETFR